MYDPPAYIWAITIAGPTAIAATTCAALYGGAERAANDIRSPGTFPGTFCWVSRDFAVI